MDATVIFAALIFSLSGSSLSQLPGDSALDTPAAQPTFVEVYLAEPSSTETTEIVPDVTPEAAESKVVEQPLADQPATSDEPTGIESAPQDQIDPLFVAENEPTVETEATPAVAAPLDEEAMAPQEVALPVDLPPEIPVEQNASVPDIVEPEIADNVFVETIPQVIVEEVQIFEEETVVDEELPAVLEPGLNNQDAVTPEPIGEQHQIVEPEAVAIPENAESADQTMIEETVTSETAAEVTVESADRVQGEKTPFETDGSNTESTSALPPESAGQTEENLIGESSEQVERDVDPFEVFDRIEVAPAIESETIVEPKIGEEVPEAEGGSDAPISTL